MPSLPVSRLSDIWAQRADILTQKSLCWSDASWVWHCLVCNCGKGREEAATRDNCTPPRPAPATPLWSSTKVKVQISNTFDHEPSGGPLMFWLTWVEELKLARLATGQCVAKAWREPLEGLLCPFVNVRLSSTLKCGALGISAQTHLRNCGHLKTLDICLKILKLHFC